MEYGGLTPFVACTEAGSGMSCERRSLILAGAIATLSRRTPGKSGPPRPVFRQQPLQHFDLPLLHAHQVYK